MKENRHEVDHKHNDLESKGRLRPSERGLPILRRLKMRFINWLLSWFRDLPGEDGLCEYQVDDPHDRQYLTRIIHDDDFPFERWKP